MAGGGGVVLVGELAPVPHYPEGRRSGFSAAPDPQGSSRIDILTHPSTKVACAAGAETVTAGRDSSSCRYSYHGN